MKAFRSLFRLPFGFGGRRPKTTGGSAAAVVDNGRDESVLTSGLAYELKPGAGRAHVSTFAYSAPADTRIEVFWKDFTGNSSAVDPALRGAVGPVLSFIVAGFEVLRFDCLGEAGHFHAVFLKPTPSAETRLWFRERSQREQVDRSLFELERNLDYYVARNPRPEVREAGLDPDEHRRQCQKAREAAVALMERFGVPVVNPR